MMYNTLNEQSKEDRLAINFASRTLFGGAIQINVPEQWKDVSLVRQVPDYQECYQDCTVPDENNSQLHGSGGCLIIEILSRETELKDEDASLFFFKDLAEANGDLVEMEYQALWSVGGKDNDPRSNTEGNLIMPALSKATTACSCIGIQYIAPLDNRTELEIGKAEIVRIELCVLRLESEETDILISLTMPLSSDEEKLLKSNGKHMKELGRQHSSIFLEILKGFEIIDWHLFC